jgi:hypothetical protein
MPREMGAGAMRDWTMVGCELVHKLCEAVAGRLLSNNARPIVHARVLWLP